MENSLEIRTVKPTIESILLYGSESTIDSTMRNKLDGCYIKLLRMDTHEPTSWKDKLTDTQLCTVQCTLYSV